MHRTFLLLATAYITDDDVRFELERFSPFSNFLCLDTMQNWAFGI